MTTYTHTYTCPLPTLLSFLEMKTTKLMRSTDQRNVSLSVCLSIYLFVCLSVTPLQPRLNDVQSATTKWRP